MVTCLNFLFFIMLEDTAFFQKGMLLQNPLTWKTMPLKHCTCPPSSESWWPLWSGLKINTACFHTTVGKKEGWRTASQDTRKHYSPQNSWWQSHLFSREGQKVLWWSLARCVSDDGLYSLPWLMFQTEMLGYCRQALPTLPPPTTWGRGGLCILNCWFHDKSTFLWLLI
jgi:hypothetical protein